MNPGIIIGAAGLVLAGLIYFANRQRNRMQQAAKKKDASHQSVLDTYLQLRRANKTSGPDGLRRAGVTTLESDAEIRAVIEELVQRGEKHPLGSEHALLDSIDLRVFFFWANEKDINFFTTPLEQLVQRFESEV